MSPLNNNTLSSSSLQHHQHPQHHSHHGHNNPQQQHEMNVTSSSSPTSTFNTSVAKGSPPMTSVASNVNEERIKVGNFGRPCTFCNECTSRRLLNRIHSALYYATLSPSLSIYSYAHQRWRRSAPATAVAGAARKRLKSRKFST